MIRNFERALTLVLKHEGGFSDHPMDKGGATNKGITIGTYRRYVKPNATVDDLKSITAAEIATIYRRHYWNAVKADELPSGLDYAVFDYAVNSGPALAIKHLQEVVGAAADGKIGPATLTAAKASPASIIIVKLATRRMKFLKALDTWGTFGKGWTRRVKDVETEALRMASNGPTEQPASAPKPVPAPQAHAKPSPAPVPPPAVQPGIVALVLAAGAAFLAWAGDVPCNLIGVLCQ